MCLRFGYRRLYLSNWGGRGGLAGRGREDVFWRVKLYSMGGLCIIFIKLMATPVVAEQLNLKVKSQVRLF